MLSRTIDFFATSLKKCDILINVFNQINLMNSFKEFSVMQTKFDKRISHCMSCTLSHIFLFFSYQLQQPWPPIPSSDVLTWQEQFDRMESLPGP